MRAVYARSDPAASEPLIALCRTEAEARAVEREVSEVGSGAEVRWETHEVSGAAGDVVHAVVQASSSPDLFQEPDPIVLGVFARRDEAELHTERRRRRDGVDHLVVWSISIGWRRPGWPFDAATPAP